MARTKKPEALYEKVEGKTCYVCLGPILPGSLVIRDYNNETDSHWTCVQKLMNNAHESQKSTKARYDATVEFLLDQDRDAPGS